MRRCLYPLCMIVLVAGAVARTSIGSFRVEEGEALAERLRTLVDRLSREIEERPENVQLYSQRGTAYFQQGKFHESLADFDKMIALDPSLSTSHWRRGITLYYCEDFPAAAKQFEIYHSFDDVDRENGIWRFLCQAEAFGIDKAREGLLKYQKDDREPFPDLYRMFAGAIDDEEVLSRIEAKRLSDQERAKQLFYADLYIGLYARTRSEPEKEAAHLKRAVENTWGKEAGGGPGYMWHVGRVHYDRLKATDEE